ncbi:MAG: hypothetical protein K6B14_02155 [Lachnospiraceae bacterium]|nr:hypothetical protein [Lachnospiraceae bacterium]
MSNEELLEQMELVVRAVVCEETAGMRADISALKEDVADLKEDIAVLKEDVAVLKEDVAVLKEDVAVIKNDVADLKLPMTTVETDVAEIKCRSFSIDNTTTQTNGTVNSINKALDIIADNQQMMWSVLIGENKVSVA